MASSLPPFVHLPAVLTEREVRSLTQACRVHLERESMPCYVLLDQLNSDVFRRIQAVVEKELGESVYYLNDFYLYTDASFQTSWHMDTELFTFARAVNAWILLAPAQIEDPICFIRDVNGPDGPSYHSVRIKGDACTFGDYCSGESEVRSLQEIEQHRIHTPAIRQGDILLLDVQRFHRTNAATPKHALAVKFLLKGPRGFLSSRQVDAELWPEVTLFNSLVSRAGNWDEVIAGLRRELQTEQGRRALSAGFYPEKFALYRQMVAGL